MPLIKYFINTLFSFALDINIKIDNFINFDSIQVQK